jgi:predicted Zn-dependent protease
LARHLSAFPGDVNATRILATYQLEEKNNPEEALRLLDAVKESAVGIERLRVLANRARVEQIQRALDPGSPLTLAITAKVHLSSGRDREAFALFRRVLKLTPGYPGAHASVAEIYRRNGHPDWAAIEQRLEKDREKDLAPEGDYKLALDLLDAEQKAFDELMQYADCWEKLDIQSRRASERGDHKAALEFARRAVALAPNDAAERGLALALFRNNQYAEALPLLEKYGMPERCAALLELGEPAQALNYLPHSGDPVEEAKLHGRIYIELNKPMQGVPKLQAQAGKDVDGSLHEILGRAYQALHQPNPAGLALRRALELRKRHAAELEIRPPE